MSGIRGPRFLALLGRSASVFSGWLAGTGGMGAIRQEVELEGGIRKSRESQEIHETVRRNLMRCLRMEANVSSAVLRANRCLTARLHVKKPTGRYTKRVVLHFNKLSKNTLCLDGSSIHNFETFLPFCDRANI